MFILKLIRLVTMKGTFAGSSSKTSANKENRRPAVQQQFQATLEYYPPTLQPAVPVMATMACERPPMSSKTTPTKKRKADELPQQQKKAKKERAIWNTDLVESLISLRFSDIAERKFSSCRNNHEKAAWWKWLTDISMNETSSALHTNKCKTDGNS